MSTHLSQFIYRVVFEPNQETAAGLRAARCLAAGEQIGERARARHPLARLEDNGLLILDANTTALVLIDLQGGILSLPLTPHGGAAVLARAVDLGRAFDAAGGTIVLVNVAFSEDYADRPNQPADKAMALPAAGLPADWSTLAPEIAALPARVRITKRQQSAFYGTELDLQLRRRGIRTVVICGIATNFGVEATARDAQNHDYAAVIAADACTSVAPTLHEFAITHILPRIARVRSSSEIVAALNPA